MKSNLGAGVGKRKRRMVTLLTSNGIMQCLAKPTHSSSGASLLSTLSCCTLAAQRGMRALAMTAKWS